MSLGFIFPGQGSQSAGMLTDVAEAYDEVQARFDEAGEAISQPLWRIVKEGPDEDLVRTEITQPALLTASVALWSIWQAEGGEIPVCLAGHSLGEYSALVCAGAIGFADAVRLVHRRGQLMQAAVPRGEGAMAAILGLDDQQVEAVCREIDGTVSAANYNAPGQVVIAGAAGPVQAAADRCRHLGARRAALLPVSGPFHCELMRPAQEAFAEALEQVAIDEPSIPVIQNVDAAVAADVADLRRKLLAQISQPVLWTASIRAMVARGVGRMAECGAGRVLSGLVKRIDKSVDVTSLGTLDGLHGALGR
ncbi:MAG TPA: ACP S-malonyltransferase [Burkholderiaceae bacterium]|nr:ACP S-malonyltransferase [Burkholderiaceae bacterium]